MGYQNKNLISKESKEKLELSFMYEPPPGAKKDNKDWEPDNNKPNYKFDWQRNWGNAPRESWVGKDALIDDKPFGIAVRHVKCLKCGKYGHINTDKECALFGKAKDSQLPIASMNKAKLVSEMKDEGMAFRWSSWDLKAPSTSKSYKILPEPEIKNANKKDKEKSAKRLIKGMNREEKLKLLKKLEKMESKNNRKARALKNKS